MADMDFNSTWGGRHPRIAIGINWEGDPPHGMKVWRNWVRNGMNGWDGMGKEWYGIVWDRMDGIGWVGQMMADDGRCGV
jgi:hypothetical protein